MTPTGVTMIGSYDYRLVALSVLIAIFASYAALELAGRVTATGGRARLAWLAGGATAMGFGIWSMHFIGMLAFRLPVPVRYHLPTVFLSLLAAIFASAVALFVVSREKMGLLQAIVGSIVMGVGIAAMHYIGMAAMRLQAECLFDPRLVTLSVALAIVISLVALWLTFHFREETEGIFWRKILSAVVMGAAIPVMHYTGMAAATFTLSTVPPEISGIVGISFLGAVGTTTATLMVLGVAMLASLVGRDSASSRQQVGPLTVLFFSVVAGMAVFETLKQLVFPHITVWESHLLTICASGFVSSSIGFFMIRKQQGLLQQAIAEVAARKRAEETLARDRSLLRTLIDNAPDYIYVKDTQNRFLVANAALARRMGAASAEELLGKTDFDYYPSELAAKYAADEQEVMRSGRPVINREERTQDSEGNAIWHLTSEVPFRDAAGNVLGLVGVGRNITEHKRAEEAHLASEQRYLDLFENAHDAIFTNDVTGRFTSVNRAAERLTGYTREEIVGMTVLQLVSPELGDITRQEIAQLAAGGEPPTREWEIITKDGRRVPLEVSTRTIYEGGKPAGIQAIARDITERKQAEGLLRESEERTRAIIESAHDAFVGMDPHGVVTDWNAQSEATFGWSRSEAMGRTLSTTIIPPRFREAHEQGLKHFLVTGEGPVLNRRIEIFALHRDGHEFPVELTISPVRRGQAYFFSAFVHDISERQRAQEDLKRAKEKAEAASRAKSEFLANMSHEIRTPMNGVIGMTELALDTDLSPEQRDYLNMVRESADSLLTIINDILDFSKIEAGKFSLDVTEFDLEDSLGTTIKMLAPRAHQKGLELACQIGHDVPTALVGDPSRLRQIITNLIGNAIKFTERGEVILRVEAESRTTGEALLRFSVSDTGIGVPLDKQQAIFEPFIQADGSMTRKYGGTGLGLTISSHLVGLLGGRIWLESEAGKGSTFHFTARFGLQKVSAPRATPRETINLQDMPVLVVDDNAVNRRILDAMLKHWLMKPTLTDGGQAGLAAMQESKRTGKTIPLVLLDGQMPDMDGFAVAEEIKKDPELAGATIMMLTSAGRRGDAARCREMGISAYLVKPIRQSELLEAILAALGKSTSRADRPQVITRHSLRETRRKFRVLLAEDNPVNQLLAVRLLEKRGHMVVVARNGKEALAALDKQAFDLVLMDIQMPEMDGFEATATIREREKVTGTHLPIVAMTAHAVKGDRERCLAAGMDAYVSKPIQTEEMFETIEKAVPIPEAPKEITMNGDEAVVDWNEALARVDGDKQLLAEIARLFHADGPKLLSALREAVALRDAKALERAAHALKSSVGNFSAHAAQEAALKLEMIGREGDLTHAEEILQSLEEQIERLWPTIELMEKVEVRSRF